MVLNNKAGFFLLKIADTSIKRKFDLVYFFIKNLYCFKQYIRLKKAFKPFKEKGLIEFGAHNLYINGYISRSYSFKNRILIGAYHYNFLHYKFSDETINRIFSGGITCWQETINQENYSVILKKEQYEGEGSLSLLFQANDLVLYFLRFSIGPDLNNIGNSVIYIGTIQGTRHIPEIKKAIGDFKDIYPPKIVMTVLESMGCIFGIKTIIGINNENQLAYKKWHRQSKIHFQYEQFFESLGGIKDEKGNYVISCPFEKKPITSISQKHRNRALAKRKKLSEIATVSKTILTTEHLIKSAIWLAVFYFLPVNELLIEDFAGYSHFRGS